MSDPKIMAGLSRYMTYGPSRLDAFAYIDPETAKRLPTAPQNMTRYVVADPKFWSMNVDRVERRYLAWMSQSQ
jgi:putative spermidine/putrescine transport system substrate-binding protein